MIFDFPEKVKLAPVDRRRRSQAELIAPVNRPRLVAP